MWSHDDSDSSTGPSSGLQLSQIVAALFPRATESASCAASEGREARSGRRKRLWEIPASYHCAIIGTCLPIADLRRLARRAGVGQWESGSDYDLHHAAVNMTCRRNGLSELIQKELDTRYALPVRRFAQARSDSDVEASWSEALGRGEVAGGLWAVMSHPRGTDAVCDRVSQDVHMLSHQIGAASRADLRRLAESEREVQALRELLQRQSGKFAAKLADKDQKVAMLEQRAGRTVMLERAMRESEARVRAAQDSGAAEELRERLRAESSRAARAEERVRQLTETNCAWEKRYAALEGALRETQRACEDAEKALDLVLSQFSAAAPKDTVCSAMDLCGRRVLCVGGRTGVVDHYRLLVERWRGQFVHHDGGLENNPKQLHTLLAGADVVICAAAHLNHGAYYVVKRYCKRNGKPCVILKNGGLSSFMRGVRALAGAPHAASAGSTLLAGA